METPVNAEAESWVIGVATVDEALTRSSALVRDLVTYLRWLRRRLADDAVRPYMRDRGFDFQSIRQRVRVSSEPLRFDELELREREAARVAGRDEDGRAYRHRTDRDDDDRNRPRVEVLDWERVRGSLRRAVILADPGMGKSFLLMAEGSRLAEEALARLDAGQSPDQVPLPAFVRLSVLATRLSDEGDDLVDRVVDGIEADRDLRAELLDCMRFFAWLRDRLHSEHGVLLLDALDEVHEGKPALLSAIDRLMQGTARPQVFLSSRIVGYERPWVSTNTLSDREMEIVVFGPPEIERFISAWFGDDNAGAGRLRTAIRDSREVAGMAGIPLLLSLLCRVAGDGHRDIPVRRVELYERVLNDLLAGVWRPRSQANDPLTVARKLRLLRAVAWHFATARGWRDHLPLGELDDVLRRASQEAGLGGDQLRELSEEDGILVRGGADHDRQAPLLFLHRTFHEYLVASFLRGSDDADLRVRVIAREWDNLDWAEVFALYAALSDGDSERLDELFGTIIDNDYPELDQYLARPQLTCLRLADECPHMPTGRVFADILDWLETDEGPWLLRLFSSRAALRTAARTDPELREALFTYMLIVDSPLRQVFAEVLASAAGDNMFRDALLQRLRDENPEKVREAIIEALAGWGREDTVRDALVDRFNNDAEPEVRLAAAKSLSALADQPTVRDALLRGSHEENWGARLGAARALPNAGDDPSVRSALVRLALDDPEFIAPTARHSLRAMGWNPQVRDELVEALESDAWAVRRSAVTALSSAADDPVVRGALIKRLADDVSNVRMKAACALAPHMGAARDILLKVASGEGSFVDPAPNGWYRGDAIGALIRSTTEPAERAAMVGSLEDPITMVRQTVTHAFARAANEPAVRSALTRRLDDDSAAVRLEAIEALAGAAPESAVREAIVRRLGDKDKFVREAAVAALATAAEESAVREALLGCLRDESQDVRGAAVRALGKYASNRAIRELLVERLDDPDAGVRHGAAKALSSAARDARLGRMS